MINNLRMVTNSLICKIIIGIIIASFFFSSINDYLFSNGQQNYIAKVNDQKISCDQFEDALISERNRIQKQLGNRYLEFTSNNMYIKSMYQKVLDHLINEKLIYQYAKRIGLNISDEQVKKTILSIRAFQFNGQFDNAQYNFIINQMGISANQYAELLREQLTIQQLMNAIFGSDFLLEKEIDKLITVATQKRVIREATVDIRDFSEKQQVNDTEIKNYYKQNKKNFTIPEQFRVDYIKLDVESFLKDVSDVDIQSYYNKHQKQFIKPQRKRYSIIQTKTKSDAKTILSEINRGIDFAKIAREKSIDIISAKYGGDIGWMESAITPNILKKLGLKEKGQLSGIIKSSIGYIIARLDDIEIAKKKPINEVRHEIVNIVRYQRALDNYRTMQRKVSIAIDNDNTSLINVERIIGIQSVKTDWFIRDNFPEELNFKPVVDAIFHGNLINKSGIPKGNSCIIPVSDRCSFVLRISEYEPKRIKTLEEVQDYIINKIKHKKAIQQAKIDISKLLSELKKSEDSKEILKKANLIFSAPRILHRIEQDPISKKTFELELPKNSKPSYGVTHDTQGNIVLLALYEVKESSTLQEEEKEDIVSNAIQHSAQVTFEALINSLRKKSKIKISSTFEKMYNRM